MKVIVFGANGFMGKAVTKEFLLAGHNVDLGIDPTTKLKINLLDKKSIENYISIVKPEAIINCAGIVDSSGDFNNNIRFSQNIIEATKDAGIKVRAIIITGSAGEYGEVTSLPVSESAQLNAKSDYGISKVKEEETSIKLSEKYDIPVVVARVFNPLGFDMKDRFLIPNLIKQIKSYNNKEIDHIEINSLDSPRDYLNVVDIARAYRILVEAKPKYNVYNIGSGISTKNAEILELLLNNFAIEVQPKIVQMSDLAEPMIASQADISRIKAELGWEPTISLEETIKGTIHASNRK